MGWETWCLKWPLGAVESPIRGGVGNDGCMPAGDAIGGTGTRGVIGEG